MASWLFFFFYDHAIIWLHMSDVLPPSPGDNWDMGLSMPNILSADIPWKNTDGWINWWISFYFNEFFTDLLCQQMVGSVVIYLLIQSCIEQQQCTTKLSTSICATGDYNVCNLPMAQLKLTVWMKLCVVVLILHHFRVKRFSWPTAKPLVWIERSLAVSRSQ